ncbi:transcriptional regulator, LysR family [Ferrimonas balearica DSM 9799]|uniref:Transcriptional regulator, LysR family n=1 Tax=Ferrimonas balearica (strain DSM 9799 / CCM 4581 / KCTC 23876 / PAT) TaxID=550540 RepID=E1SR67_FERBD|nr:LysR family transcriptional regulator [Ferrimonas balearica]ADN74832.1 transcriptional regulator, LysR family [Ferrimonas balearica DSM 9799]
MDLKSLECFLILSRTGNFTRTAEQLHLTQPTVSKMVQKLEQQLGQNLVRRQPHGIALTEAGQHLAQTAAQILAQWQQLEGQVNALSALERGTLKLGICPMVSPLAAPLLSAYRQRYPGITLDFYEDGGYGCEKALLNDRLAISFTALPTTHLGEFASQSLVRYPLWVCLPKGHPLADYPALDWATLARHPVIFYNEDFALTQWLTRLSQRAGVELNVVLRSAQWDFIGAMVEVGLGLTILPQPICERLPAGQLEFRPLSPALNWEIGLIWRQRLPLDAPAEAFLALAKTMMGQPATPA